MSYIQVCLPLRLDWNPWYSTTEDVHVGQRVAVRFARKPYVGVVVSVGGQPDVANVFSIDSADTGLADITEAEMKLWEFVSSYYMCTLGEVYKVAYPIAKVRGEMQALRMEDRFGKVREKKRLALEAKISKLEKSVGLRENALKGKHNDTVTARLEEELSHLLEQLNLVRLELDAMGAEPAHKAYQNTIDFGEKPVLLWGTERVPVYLDEIRRTLDAGRSVLVLEPETDFGFNLSDALGRGLGDRLLFYGATSTDKQKREVMLAVRDSSRPIAVIGVRSAVFLPWTDLGLVIVDEEQDVSLKQSEPAPLYNGRDVAAMLSRLHGARLILGSACPSLETLSNCLNGKYEMMHVSEKLPTVEIIDIPAERHKRGMVGNYSRRALEEIRALPSDALITIVRCYQTEEDALSEMRSLFPDRDPQLLTAVAARKSGSHSTLTLVLQADALFDRSDFRADEKALQMLCSIRSHTDRLIVQCGASAHPVYRALSADRPVSGGKTGRIPAEKAISGSSGGFKGSIPDAMMELLSERRSFNLPPYTRLVDIRDKGGVVRREVLPRDASLAARKASLRLQYGALYSFDVDPL